jgi:transposase
MVCLHLIIKMVLANLDRSRFKEHVCTGHYHNSKALVDYIRDSYGIEYSSTGMVDLLHRLGFTYKKPKIIPGD